MTYHHFLLSQIEVFDPPVFDGSSDASLTTLNLSNNNLTSIPLGLSCLAPTLKKLNLSNNSIKHMGLAHLYPLSLTYLNLSKNEIEDQFVDTMDCDRHLCHSVGKLERHQRLVTDCRLNIAC